MTIRHIVILNFKKETGVNYYELLQTTHALIDTMPGVIDYMIYKNESKYTPDDTTSIGIQINFENDVSLETFMENPLHFVVNDTFKHFLSDPPFMVLTYHEN